MPIKWFICPDYELIEKDRCLAEGGCRRKRRCQARQLLNQAGSDRIWNGQPSTTQCITGTMQAFLKLTKDYAVSPDQRAFMSLGTNVHAGLEAAEDCYSLVEQRLELNGGDITGIADVLEEENGKVRLIDFKTSGSYKVMKALGLFTYDMETGEVFKTGPRKGLPKTVKGLNQSEEKRDMDDWQWQLNLYRMMYEQAGFTINEMWIQCIVRDGGTRSALSRGIHRNTYLIPVRYVADKLVKEYFYDKRTKLLKALEQGYWDEPCNDVENWDGMKCLRFCEVWEHCQMGRYRHEVIEQQEEGEEMPIGYTGIQRFVNFGALKLGKTEVSAKGIEHPVEFDHFELQLKTQDPKIVADYTQAFEKEYGVNPKAIEVELMGGVVEEILDGNYESVFPQNYYRWTSSQLLACSNWKCPNGIARCASEKYVGPLKVLKKNDDGTMEVECKWEECPYRKETEKGYKLCTPSATLSVVLPKVDMTKIWTIRPRSYNSIVNVNNGLQVLAVMMTKADIPLLHGMKVRIERVPQMITHKGIPTEHYPLKIDTQMRFPVSMIEKLSRSQAKLKTAADIFAIETGDLPALPAASEEIDAEIDTETGEVIDMGKADEAPPVDNTNELSELEKAVSEFALKIGSTSEDVNAYSMKWGSPEKAFEMLSKALANDDMLKGMAIDFNNWKKKTG